MLKKNELKSISKRIRTTWEKKHIKPMREWLALERELRKKTERRVWGCRVEVEERGITGLTIRAENRMCVGMLVAVLMMLNVAMVANSGIFRKDVGDLTRIMKQEREMAQQEYMKLKEVIEAQRAILQDLGIEPGGVSRRREGDNNAWRKEQTSNLTEYGAIKNKKGIEIIAEGNG